MATTAPDFAAEGLLDGLTGDERAARAELLAQLHAAGVPMAELRSAVAEERLALVPVDLVLGGRGRYTEDEVAQRAGVGVQFLRALRQALGVSVPEPGARDYTDEDLEAAAREARFQEAGFTEEGLLDVTRVIGQSMARIAESMRALTADALSRAGDTEHDLAQRLSHAARELAPLNGAVLEYALNLHLREQLRTDVVSSAEAGCARLLHARLLPGAREVAVCFADLVGFTRLGSEVPAEELGAVAGRLAALAAEVTRPPLRLVKTIGDAAMFVGPDAAKLVAAALELVDAADAEGETFPQLRAGVAVGPALSRGGDWYGHTVNLASRVTGVAPPGSVLATAAVRDAAGGDAFAWSAAGPRRLKGISEPVELFRASRREPDASPPAAPVT
jgi:adenylate cyclase